MNTQQENANDHPTNNLVLSPTHMDQNTEKPLEVTNSQPSTTYTIFTLSSTV